MGFDSEGTRACDLRVGDRSEVATAQQKTVLVAALVNVKPHHFTGSVDAPSLSEDAVRRIEWREGAVSWAQKVGV